MPHRGLKKCPVVWWALSCHQHKKTQKRWCWTLGEWVTILHCLYIVCRNYSGFLLQVSEYPPGWPLQLERPCWPCVISSTVKAAFLYTDCGCQLENNVFILFGCTGEYHQAEDVGGIWQSSAQSKSKLQRLVYSTAPKVTGRTEKLLLQAIYGQTVLRQVVFFLPDLPHILHSECELLPSGRRYRVPKCKLNSFKYSFVPTSKFSMAPEGVEVGLYIIWGCMECARASWCPTFFECVLFFLFLHYVQWVMYSMFLCYSILFYSSS